MFDRANVPEAGARAAIETVANHSQKSTTPSRSGRLSLPGGPASGRRGRQPAAALLAEQPPETLQRRWLVSGFGSAKALRVVKWSISLDGNADA
jgi:hypothetical protein